MAHQYRQGRLLTPTGVGTVGWLDIGDEVARAYRRAMDALEIHTRRLRPCFGLSMQRTCTSPTMRRGRSRKIRRKADRLTQVLFDAAEAIRLAAVLLSPIMPASSRARSCAASAHASEFARPRSRRPLALRRRAHAHSGCAALAPFRQARLRRRKLCPRPSRQHQPHPRQPLRLPRQRHPAPPHHLRWPRPPPMGVFPSISS